jgi:hypothetical protein
MSSHSQHHAAVLFGQGAPDEGVVRSIVGLAEAYSIWCAFCGISSGAYKQIDRIPSLQRKFWVVSLFKKRFEMSRASIVYLDYSEVRCSALMFAVYE